MQSYSLTRQVEFDKISPVLTKAGGAEGKTKMNSFKN